MDEDPWIDEKQAVAALGDVCQRYRLDPGQVTALILAGFDARPVDYGTPGVPIERPGPTSWVVELLDAKPLRVAEDSVSVETILLRPTHSGFPLIIASRTEAGIHYVGHFQDEGGQDERVLEGTRVFAAFARRLGPGRPLPVEELRLTLGLIARELAAVGRALERKGVIKRRGRLEWVTTLFIDLGNTTPSVTGAALPNESDESHR